MLSEQEILCKYLLEILPTKKRLKDIRRATCSTCDFCTQEESNIHFVFQCERYSEVVHWFKGILENLCRVRNPRFISLSFLDIPKICKKSKNATIMMVATFIVNIWQVRQNNMSPSVAVNYVKGIFL